MDKVWVQASTSGYTSATLHQHMYGLDQPVLKHLMKQCKAELLAIKCYKMYPLVMEVNFRTLHVLPKYGF